MTTEAKKGISRRDFLKYAGGGIAVLVVGSKLSWAEHYPAFADAAVQSLNFEITDAEKGMVTDNAINRAKCYFWVYKSFKKADGTGIDLQPECPGPTLVAKAGDTINISITNNLSQSHALYIPGFGPGDAVVFDTGEILPGATFTGTINLTNAKAGAYLYYDNLNSPVNRVMGLHGALIVMPAAPAAGHKFTPYSNPTDGVQRMYDDFGTAHFPGLAWEQGDTSNWSMAPVGKHIDNCPPFRQYVWLTHQASPKLFAEVGNTPGNYNPQVFVEKFLRGTFKVNNSSLSSDIAYTPQFFTINGQSGMMSHFNPTVTPMGRVGEPVVVHILNAGLWTHSMHLHANHMWITSVDGVVNPNPIWVDVFRVDPMSRIDYTIPYMRPPDVGHTKGIGPIPGDTALKTINNKDVWPPVEEFEVYMPAKGTKASGSGVELGQRMSPLCYPMHDHSEPSQTAQGGNYNCGLISGIYFTGDRNGMMDFPMDEDFQMAYQNLRGVAATQPAAPLLGQPLM